MEGRQNARLEFQLSQGMISGNVSIHILTANIDARGKLFYTGNSTLKGVSPVLGFFLQIES